MAPMGLRLVEGIKTPEVRVSSDLPVCFRLIAASPEGPLIGRCNDKSAPAWSGDLNDVPPS